MFEITAHPTRVRCVRWGYCRNGRAGSRIGRGADAEADFHVHWAEQAFSATPASPASHVPFSFVYGGRRSSELLGKWKRTVTEEPAAGGKQRRILTLTDPETGLEVRAVATVYTDTPSVEWTLYFTNKGEKDTPILEQDQGRRRDGEIGRFDGREAPPPGRQPVPG